MVQTVLPLKGSRRPAQAFREEAKAVGLTCEQDTVTLRFLGDDQLWGQPARQVRLDRQLAEQLSRLLNDEFDD